MATLKNHVAFEIARGLKAFLALEAGVTRGAVPDMGSPRNSNRLRVG